MGPKFKNVEHEVIYNKMIKTLNIEADNNITSGKSLTNNGLSTDLTQYIRAMEANKNNEAHRYLHSHRKVIGHAIIFSKKVARKLLKWYINPITQQQTAFNNAATSALARTSEVLGKTEEDINELNIKYENSDGKIQQLQNVVTLVNDKYEDIDFELQKLQNAVSFTSNKYEDLESELQQLKKQHQELLTKVSKIEEVNSVLLEKYDLSTNEESFFEKKTFGQSGEDSILAYILHFLRISFESVTYIDLGANHAKEMSNTYFFYNKGAKGVLVEANPHLIAELKFYRNRDIVLNNVIDVVNDDEVEFFILSGDGLSTVDYKEAQKFGHINPEIEIVDKKLVKTITYEHIVEQYLGKAPTILSIDIEGKDFEILQSIDFDKYRPLLIVVEMIDYNTKLNYKTKNNEVLTFLNSKNYDEYAFTGINSIFIDKEFLNKRID
ncbi:hypothetical protein D7X33_29680 [Butyricicoccus sp. 1XD8-22]|nr:hypothetical protein D7X33_29680 [Butyricicoccus sp. 1XD8-22]